MPNENLLDRAILILDGGLGTSLEDLYHVKFSHETPLWSSQLLISAPELLSELQRQFSNAGSDVILTPTYQASHTGFRKSLPGVLDDEIRAYFHSAVSISRNACGGKLVALSLGAYGATLQPSQEFTGSYGDIDEDGLVSFHRERLSAFDPTAVDLIAFETIPRLDEVRAVKRVVDGSKPYWISCVFPNDNKLPDGTPIEAVLDAMMYEPRPWGIGINCTKVEKVMELVDDLERAAHRWKIQLPRLVLYPDGTNGQVYDTEKQVWVGHEDANESWHQKMFEVVKVLYSRKTWPGLVVGGCCKTLPKHIEELSALVHGLVEGAVLNITTV